MPSSKYHHEQAKVLAGLALSANDPAKAEQFKLAAMEHLERAQEAEIRPPRTPDSTADKPIDSA
jgi:hypothetical protein